MEGRKVRKHTKLFDPRVQPSQTASKMGVDWRATFPAFLYPAVGGHKHCVENTQSWDFTL